MKKHHKSKYLSIAKLACEYYLRYAGRAYNFPYTILRQTNTYGRIDNDFCCRTNNQSNVAWRHFKLVINYLIEIFYTLMICWHCI